MQLILPANQPSIAIGGAVFTDLRNLIQLAAYCDATAGARYSTLRAANGTAGYAVTALKTYKIRAFASFIASGALASRFIQFGYGDTDVGLSGVAAPSNPVYISGSGATANIIAPATTGTAANPRQEVAMRFDVPAGKYAFIAVTSGLEVISYCYGQEE